METAKNQHVKEGDERLTYSVPDIARALGIGRLAAYKLTKRADFPSVTIGRRIVVPKIALERWLNNQKG